MALDPVVTDRTDRLPVDTDRVWAVLADVAGYPRFWPWLRSFDGRSLASGETWHGVIGVAGPFRLGVAIELGSVVAGRSVAARLTGDLSGTAQIDLRPDADGTMLHLVAALAPQRADLRLLTRCARPAAQASHDRVIARALDQLATHLDRA